MPTIFVCAATASKPPDANDHLLPLRPLANPLDYFHPVASLKPLVEAFGGVGIHAPHAPSGRCPKEEELSDRLLVKPGRGVDRPSKLSSMKGMRAAVRTGRLPKIEPDLLYTENLSGAAGEIAAFAEPDELTGEADRKHS